jgi:uncharacterized sulfatase
MGAISGIWLTAAALTIPQGPAHSAALSYDIDPGEIAGGCYAITGSTGYFNTSNGGFIVNTGFILTDEGVVVIDTGPSRRFGEQLRKKVESLSTDRGLPGVVNRVFITHGHPDHYLGNQAFGDVPIYGGQGTIELIAGSGEDFTTNMYRLSGDWMRGTESLAPDHVATPGIVDIGDHRLHIIQLAGHTVDDIAIFDETCGVLYAGDLVFNRRTLSTPHADMAVWRQALDTLAEIPFSVLVPGHGDITRSVDAIAATRRYLTWLEETLVGAYRSGLDITEVMELPLPGEFSGYALAREEFRRTVHNLFPALEASLLPLINAD